MKFKVGDKVVHRHHGYNGVVMALGSASRDENIVIRREDGRGWKVGYVGPALLIKHPHLAGETSLWYVDEDSLEFGFNDPDDGFEVDA